MCIFFFFFLSFPIRGTRDADDDDDGGLVLLSRFERTTRKRF
jgi:hypothetical protein